MVSKWCINLYEKGTKSRRVNQFTSMKTCSLQRPFKPAILCFNRRLADVLARIPFFESFAGSRVNMPLVAVTNVGWRVYTPVFLGIRGNTPPTKGTAVNEWVHSFVDFCRIPYPRPVPLTYQPRICKDGFISIVFDVSPECRLFDRVVGR